MKKLLGILAVLAVLVVAAYFVLNNPLGRLVKLAVEQFVPPVIQASVHLDEVTISSTDGLGEIHGLVIGNPPGFKSGNALEAGTIRVGLLPASIADDVIVIRQLLIESPHITYEKNEKGSNFDALQHNIETFLGSDSDSGNGKKQGGDRGGKKMIIDTFSIHKARVSYADKVDIEIPDIELHNVGRSSGGATSAQVAKAIITELNKKMMTALAREAIFKGANDVVEGAGMMLKGVLSR